MNILSWNILSGGFKDYGSLELIPERMNGLTEAIKQSNPHVVCLIDTYRWTEVFSDTELKKIFNYPDVLTVKLDDERLIAKGHDNGITVLSRVSNAKLGSVRIATRNAIKVQTPELDIFSVYLDDLSEDTRLKQVKEIFNLVNKNRPTIIIGDLNTMDWDEVGELDKNLGELSQKFPEPIKAMTPVFNEMRRGEVTKLLGNNGFADLGRGKGNTAPAKLCPLPISGPMMRIDYAFGNKQIILEDFKVLTDEPFASLSDHYPIEIDIKLL